MSALGEPALTIGGGVHTTSVPGSVSPEVAWISRHVQPSVSLPGHLSLLLPAPPPPPLSRRLCAVRPCLHHCANTLKGEAFSARRARQSRVVTRGIKNQMVPPSLGSQSRDSPLSPSKDRRLYLHQLHSLQLTSLQCLQGPASKVTTDLPSAFLSVGYRLWKFCVEKAVRNLFVLQNQCSTFLQVYWRSR